MSCDVSLLRQFSTETFSTMLRQIPGDKDLVIDNTLMKPLDRIAGMALLKECGVNKIFKLDKVDFSSRSTNRVFLLPSAVRRARSALDTIRTHSSSSVTNYLVFVPKALQSFHVMLEEEGLSDTVEVRDFSWQLLPLDADLLSLELPIFFNQSIIRGDLSLLSVVSKTLFDVECLYGKIPNRVGLGKRSSAILTQLELLETSLEFDRKEDGEIGHLVLMDRDYDFVSALLSPVTYEALLDEVFGITCGAVDFTQSDAAKQSEKLANIRLELSTRDKVFENIRFKHFSSIFSFLSNSAKQLRQSQAKAASMNVNQMKDFVQQNLRDLQQQSKAIAIHIGASEIIQSEKGYFYENLLPLEVELIREAKCKESLSFLEQAMSTLQPIEVTLRLMCLASIGTNGLSQADYTKLKKLFCEAYGFKHLATLGVLCEMGLLRVRQVKDSRTDLPPSFQALAQKVDLIPRTERDDDRGDQMSAVFNGLYVPLVARVVKILLETPAQLLDIVSRSSNLPSSSVSLQRSSSSKVGSKNVLIFFVGGYTMAEVAALKSLQATCGYRFLVAGTGNVTGKSVINAVLEECAS